MRAWGPTLPILPTLSARRMSEHRKAPSVCQALKSKEKKLQDLLVFLSWNLSWEKQELFNTRGSDDSFPSSPMSGYVI